jgi:hypothetical protein
MGIYVIGSPIMRSRLQEIAGERFGDLVKGVVDIEKNLLIVGAELHIDAATELQEKYGSLGRALWGINLYPAEEGEKFIEFDSMINLKPALKNRTRGVESEETRNAIIRIVRDKVIDFGL